MTAQPAKPDFLRPRAEPAHRRHRSTASGSRPTTAIRSGPAVASSARSAQAAQGVAGHRPALRPDQGPEGARGEVHPAVASRARSTGTSPTTASARPGAARCVTTLAPYHRPARHEPPASSRAGSPPPATSRSCRATATGPRRCAARSAPWAGPAATTFRPTSGSTPAAAARSEVSASISRARSTRTTSPSAAARWSKAASSCARAFGNNFGVAAVPRRRHGRHHRVPELPGAGPVRCRARACATSRRSGRSASIIGFPLNPRQRCRRPYQLYLQHRSGVLIGPHPVTSVSTAEIRDAA